MIKHSFIDEFIIRYLLPQQNRPYIKKNITLNLNIIFLVLFELEIFFSFQTHNQKLKTVGIQCFKKVSTKKVKPNT